MSAVVSVATSIPITLYDSTGAGRAGLTVTSVARKAGTSTTVSATSVTDRSNGDYDVNITFPSVGTWRVTSTATIDGDTVPDLTDVQVETAAQSDPAASITTLYGTAFANLDAAVSTRATAGNVTAAVAALSGVTVSLVSPVSTDATVITLVRGNDYLNADGRAVAFTVSSPSLVGATVTLRIYTYAGVTALSKAMTVSGTTVRADITSSETTALSLGTPAYKFTVTAVLADASTIRPASGTVWVTD